MSQDKEFYTTFFALMGGLTVFAIILVILAGKLTSGVSDDKPEEIVLENIKPVGQVYIAGESEPEADPAADTAVAAGGDSASTGPRSGEDVYNSKCMACHATGAAGAPKLGDVALWAPRIAAGMDSMMANAIKGLNAMPPKGLCMACSDEELQGAIEYIVSKSQ
ncbi:MAG: c-type cytochrome [Pseudomonadota bacterium]